MADKLTLTEAIVNRRTYYAINKELPISDDRVVELVKFAITNVPSAFNSQSARLVVLFKNEHEKFWDLVLEALRAIVPAEQFPASEQRIGGFKAGYGSVSQDVAKRCVLCLAVRSSVYAGTDSWVPGADSLL